MNLLGVDVDVDWAEGRGVPLTSPERAREIPAGPGLYAFVHYPSRGVRVGEGLNVRRRFVDHVRWLRQMADGTAREQDYRRLRMPNPDGFMVAAQKYGCTGFQFHVLCADPRLAEKGFRQELERAVFEWIRQGANFEDWNRQRSWR